jgi:DNA repair exonuclease SbcCD ATPase subunit/predicted phosphodiesterase
MSNKVLIVSDIHIHAYPNRNPSNDYRLYQGSRKVPENIIKVAKNTGCDYLILAGDVAEKCIMRPYVEAEIKYFLDRLMSYFKEGWIIWGNHDLDNKSADQSITDSSLYLMLPTNLHYAHQTQTILGNTTIAFNNWQPEFNLEWIKNKVDLLVTHARINYTGNANFQSQELDETKFDLAICGDIHSAGQVGKYVSIGVPQRCKMGDSEDATGVIFDCDNKTWEWVDLDPDKNLMKFTYTTELDKEGWVEDENTWYVYKPDAILQDNLNVSISPWQQIETMVNETIEKTGMAGVHGEVLKNITNLEANEVDFNFQLVSFHCENWRSIDNLTINFDNYDKILIKGANGSGKTSLLSAIKYAFVDVKDTVGLTSLKPFIQFGAKKCLTEIEFMYQGNKYKISRGSDSKDCGLIINDIPQKYADKNSFEKDVRERFPFIKYIDAFFFDSEHHQFIGGTSQERITEIVSKFLKLDRLDTFNQTSRSMLEYFKTESSDLLVKQNEINKVISFIDDKMSTITLPNTPKQELQNLLKQGNDILEGNRLWLEYKGKQETFNNQINFYQSQKANIESKISQFKDRNLINNEISNLQTANSDLQNKMSNLSSAGIELQHKNKEITDLRNEGNKIWLEAQSIKIGAKCPTCGQVISTPEALINHKNDLLKKVEELKPKIAELENQKKELEIKANSASQEYNIYSQCASQNNSKIAALMSELKEQDSILSQLNSINNNINTCQNNLNNLRAVPEVILPENFMDSMSTLQQQLSVWAMWESNMNDKIQKQTELNDVEFQLNKFLDIIKQLEDYSKLTGPTGIIYENIMNNLKDKFSDNLVRYVVIRKGTGNREHLSLRPEYFNNGNWIPYDVCSSGQKTVLDVHFMSKIISGLGLLVFDEFLKALDPQNHDICIDMIKDMNIYCTIISSHMESIAVFNNKVCEVSINNGVSNFNIN